MKRGEVIHSNPAVAIQQLAEQIKIPEQSALIFFCSADYDPEIVSRECNKHFDCLILGCSSAGEIGCHYQSGGIVGLSLSKSDFAVSAQFVSPLSEYGSRQAEDTMRALRAQLNSQSSDNNLFAFCLIDGLSVLEEAFVATTYGVLSGIPLLGGSAGDSLKFERTIIYCGDKFGSNAAVLALFETSLPFEIFQLKHFAPTETEMVITSADPESRIVFEIDGGPAAEEYARLLGLTPDQLTPLVFSANPVMLQIGEEWYVRSIQRANHDQSLTFYCAIDEGIPLTLARGENLVENLRERAQQMCQHYKEVLLTIGCDCILRRLEIEQKGLQKEVEDILQQIQFFGFSTFGEQVNSIHVNQTLTGVVFGRRS